MEIKVPEVGESVFEALVARWRKQDGERVAKDEPICEIETDKITLELTAEAAGVLSVRAPEGTTVKIGAVIGAIDETGVAEVAPPVVAEQAPHVSPSERKKTREVAAPKAKQPVLDLAPRTSDLDALKLPPEVKSEEPPPYEPKGEGRERRIPMTPIRRRIAERLVAARSQTAMLTTFNEADISRIKELRDKHGEQFQKKHGIKLGFMSFFIKACCEALKEFPAVNARIDGDDIVYHNFYDIGIAVSGEKGLVVPVIRDAERLHFADIEKAIAEFAEKVRTNRLALADLEGGTFTITNGGVFGSLLSTPIINPPQSGVLGMHAIQDRPVARGGKTVIRPMMYLALSYDHRIIDGREAVGFLKAVKEYVEEPEEMLLEF